MTFKAVILLSRRADMTHEQFLFVMAIDAFKKGNARQFPTWTDVLEVIRLLGYRKTMPSELRLNNAEDWTENSDAPARATGPRDASSIQAISRPSSMPRRAISLRRRVLPIPVSPTRRG